MVPAMPDSTLPPLANGVQFGDEFRIERTLGQGGFGITYLVTALRSESGTIVEGERYVVKEFAVDRLVRRGGDGLLIEACGTNPEEIARNSEVFERLRAGFEEEARTLLRFTHKNIVEVLLVREGNGTSYMVMEFINGQSLQQRLEATLASRGAPLNWPELEPIALALIDALDHVHERGVIHRDIKPANIMLRANGSPVLIDFGGAKPVERANSSIVLTPGFAPLEQFQHLGGNPELIGKASDIFSLAAVFYVSLTGKLPYALDQEGRPAVASTPLLNHPNQLLIGLPDEPARAIDSALDFATPAQRPQTVRSWRAAFQSAAPSQPPQPVAKKTQSSTGRGPSVLGVVGVTLGAVGVLGALTMAAYFYILQQNPEKGAIAIEFQVDGDWITVSEAVSGDSFRTLPPMNANAVASFSLDQLDDPARSIALVADKPIRIRYRDGANEYRVLRSDQAGNLPRLPSNVATSQLELRAEQEPARVWVLDESGASLVLR